MTAYSIANQPKTKRRILHLASGDLWAGAEVQLYHLARYLQSKSEVELLVVLLNPGELQQRLQSSGVKVRVIDESKHGLTRLFTALIRIARDFQPDVIHTHRQKENLLGSLATLILPGTRSLRTVHGANEHRPRAGQAIKRFRLALDRWLGRHLQHPIICVSSELKDDLLAEYPAHKMTVIENGIDVATVNHLAMADDVQLDKQRFCVAFLARMVPVKRVDIFVAIAQLAEQQHPGKFHFYALGDGPSLAAAQAQATLHRLNNITFTGFLANAPQWLVNMDALCITSDHEGLPIGLLEAMALRVPVVARRVGGIGSALDDGTAGILIASKEASAFLDGLNQLRCDKLYSEQLKAAAWLQVNRQFSVQHMADQYTSIYLQK